MVLKFALVRPTMCAFCAQSQTLALRDEFYKQFIDIRNVALMPHRGRSLSVAAFGQLASWCTESMLLGQTAGMLEL
jgi:hypothetical protein